MGASRGRMRQRIVLALTFTALCILPAAAQPPAQSMFVFRNNFWLNLHQFLRGEIYRRGAKLPPGLDATTLSDADRARWASAIETYVDVSKHDNLFDDWSIKTHRVLASLGDATVVPDGAIDAAVAAALNAAAPIYRARLWPERRADNERWIASTKDVLEGREAAVKSQLAAAYHITWPKEPYLVVPAGEVGNASAFTHTGPAGYAAMIQAGAASPRNVDGAPLELLFHEASHVLAVGGHITEMIDAEGKRQHVMPPMQLWHHMIMVTSGEIAKKVLAASNRPGYRRYDERYNEQIPASEKSAFEAAWLPYLDGKIPFKQALHDLVRDAR
jgi:hypothetical protein